MIRTIINEENENNADVVLLSLAYEKTASSHKGTINGPKRVIECLDTQIEFFDRKYKAEINDYVRIAHKDPGNLEILSPDEMVAKVETTCEELLAKNKFIFLLGGEHSVSIGHFQALAKKYDPHDITILQIDAHCDLRTSDNDYSVQPSSFAHSTVMRHASTLGFPLVQVGIRTYSKEEHDYFSDPKNNVTVFEWGNGNIVPPIEKILSSIKTKYLYITIDVDGFDPSHMPGTGTPVQGGLEWWYGMDLLERTIISKELVGADIVEVSPTEGTVLAEYGAAQLCYSMIAHKFRQKFADK